jgi:hypothetical protein
MRRSLVATAVAVFLAVALAPPAAARLPKAGTLVPGRSLGGIQLGESPGAVRSALGTFYGACRACPRQTWYFTYRPFDRQGLAVEFTRGEVSAIYTLWQPRGWHGPHRLRFGSSPLAVHTLGHTTRTVTCPGYNAFMHDGAQARTAYYVFRGGLWGFGLFPRDASPCR